MAHNLYRLFHRVTRFLLPTRHLNWVIPCGSWIVRGGVALLIAFSVSACGGGGGAAGSVSGGGSSSGSGSGSGATPTYTVGGSISGLTASGLVLTDSGGDSLAVASGATTFTFSQAVSTGTAYSVAVATQPSSETCTVVGGSGTVTADVTSVNVSCAADTYTVGGSISGLTSSGLVLSDNGGDNLSVASGAVAFTFSQVISFGASYSVAVAAQPSGETCSVTGGSGTATGDVTSIGVACTVNTYTVGGSISGLIASGLVLSNNGGDNLSVSSGAGAFTFSQAVPYGANYSVAIAAQPSGETCVVTSGSGTATGNVASVGVDCTVNTYSIGGKITGLNASGLVLADNGGDNLAVALGSASFTFSQTLQPGSGYDVTVAAQPVGETCSVVAGSGVATANVDNVSVSCAPDMYTISGSISGLSNSGLILQLNGQYDQSISAGSSSFTFSNSLAVNTTFSVTVYSQPNYESCTVSSGSGAVTGSVTNVTVNCAVLTYTVSGTISAPASVGLSAGLKLQEYSGGAILSMAAGATSFAFTTPVAGGTNINVTPTSQPSWQTCTAGASNINGPISANVTNDVFVCASDSATGSAISLPSGTAFNLPDGLALDAAGDLFIADSGNNRIVEISHIGTVSYPLTAANGLNGPMGVAVDSTGTIIYVANTNANDVLEDNNGVVTSLGAGFNQPEGIAVDGSGDVFVADTGNSEVKEISGGVVTQLGTSYVFAQPSGVAVGSSGNVYVADTGNNAVVEVSGSAVTKLAGTFNLPFGVAVDSAGNVYVADNDDFEVRMIVPTGGVTTLAGSTSAQGVCTANPPLFQNPYGVAVDSSTGVVYVADYTASAVCKLTP